MEHSSNSPLRRIGIFYDGSFFMRLSQFFGQIHSRRSYIDIDGFHRFIGDRVANVETDGEPELCKIVESHFFRGRFSLESAKKANALESDRFINPVLREFYQERDVVMEERRMRTDSSPVGRLVEEFIATAFKAHPYGQPTVGHMSDLMNLSRTDAVAFFE